MWAKVVNSEDVGLCDNEICHVTVYILKEKVCATVNHVILNYVKNIVG